MPKQRRVADPPSAPGVISSPAGVEPRHVLDAELLVVRAGQEAPAPQDRLAPARSSVSLRTNSSSARPSLVDGLPVDPGDLVVLAVGVVVAAAGVRPNSSPASSIGVPCDKQQRREHVAHLALAQRADLGSSVGPSTP